MPIYEYACKACEHEFETIQKLSEAPLVDCPACGEAGLRKKVSAAAFRLKGGGWYETDFKSGSKRNLHGEQASGKETGEKAASKEAGGESGNGGSDKTKEQGGSAAAGKSSKGEGKTGSSNGKPAAASSGGAKAKAAAPAD